MARYPYAAETLAEEYAALHGEDVTYEPVGDPDGYDVHRTVRYDKDVGIELAALLGFLDDPRVPTVNLTDAGYLHVTFAGDSPTADNREPFMLEVAAEMLAGRQDPDEPDDGPGE